MLSQPRLTCFLLDRNGVCSWIKIKFIPEHFEVHSCTGYVCCKSPTHEISWDPAEATGKKIEKCGCLVFNWFWSAEHRIYVSKWFMHCVARDQEKTRLT